MADNDEGEIHHQEMIAWMLRVGNILHSKGLIDTEERRQLHNRAVRAGGGDSQLKVFTHFDLTTILDRRDKELAEERNRIAKNHEPEQERQEIMEKIDRRRDELRKLKRLINEGGFQQYLYEDEGDTNG